MFGCFFLYICTGCVKKSCCKIMKKYFYQPVEKVYIALTRQEETETRSGRAGPSFSVRPEKEAKGAVLHGTSAAERWRHVKTRSAGRTKTRRLRRSDNLCARFFTARDAMKKSPHEPRRKIQRALPRPAGSYLGCNQLLFCETTFLHTGCCCVVCHLNHQAVLALHFLLRNR